MRSYMHKILKTPVWLAVLTSFGVLAGPASARTKNPTPDPTRACRVAASAEARAQARAIVRWNQYYGWDLAAACLKR